MERGIVHFDGVFTEQISILRCSYFWDEGMNKTSRQDIMKGLHTRHFRYHSICSIVRILKWTLVHLRHVCRWSFHGLFELLLGAEGKSGFDEEQ